MQHLLGETPKKSPAPWQRGRDFLGSRYGILAGAMSWVSEHRLVAAVSNAGAFGVLAGGALAPEELDREIAGADDLTDQPFGVNLITFSPHFTRQLEVSLDRRVSHIILAGGAPTAQNIKDAKRNGAKVMGFAPSLAMGKRLLRNGTDALIVEGYEAGGHVGPVSTSVLVQELLPLFEHAPVFVAGGIGRGEMVASYLRLRAAGCQLGTRFVCARESRVHPRMKEAFVRASAREAVLAPQIDPRLSVAPVRALANKGGEAFLDLQREALDRHRRGEISIGEAQILIEGFWAGGLRRAVIDGDIEYGSLMAGQSVGCITQEQSVEEILEELLGQCSSELRRSH